MEEKDNKTQFFKYYAKISIIGFTICLIIIFLLLIFIIIPSQNHIEHLTEDFDDLQEQHNFILINLNTTQKELDTTREYKERVEQGTDITQAYKLLSDIDKLEEDVHKVTKVSYIEDDTEIWLRAKDIYKWLGNNFEFCSDKAFKVGDVYVALQFFSPDELLMYKLGFEACGDCDDYAHAFVGMMYASGVPKDRVRIEIGDHHVWVAIYIAEEDKWYDIDPVCAQPDVFINNTTTSIEQEFPNTPEDIRCIERDPYSRMFAWYDYYGFHKI